MATQAGANTAAPARAAQPDSVDRLIGLVERMLVHPPAAQPGPAPPARPHFKSPQFDGTGDLEYFIQQFDLVAEANDWDGPAAFLHLRNGLKDKAQDCGKPNTRRGIYAALRARLASLPERPVPGSPR